jgi:hemolysin III
MLVAVGGVWGWTITAVVWFLAVAGIVMKTVLVGRYDRFEKVDTGLYLLMGWLALVAIVPIFQGLSGVGLMFLVLGGVWYSVGCIFFLWESLPHNHAIWHSFVIAGSVCHFATVWHDIVAVA